MRKIFQSVILLMIVMVTLPAYAAIELNTNELYWVGQKYDYSKNYTKAIDFYNEVLNRDSNYKGIYSTRGSVYIKMEKYDLALNDFSQAIKLNPTDAGLYYNRGNIYKNIGKYELAVEDYSKVIQIRDTYSTRKARGETYVKMQMYALAMNDFNRMAEMSPRYIDSFLCKSQLYGMLGQYEEANNTAQEGLNIYNDQPVLLFILAQSYEKTGNTDEAVEYYQKALNKGLERLPVKRVIPIKNKINARLVGDWDSYSEWVIY